MRRGTQWDREAKVESRPQQEQTAGVWVVVNHPEMRLFPPLNEAETTKGRAACGRGLPASQPQTHMTASFRSRESIQKSLEINPTSRRLGQWAKSSQNWSPQMRGPAFKGDQNHKAGIERGKLKEKEIFFLEKRGGAKNMLSLSMAQLSS